MARSIWIKQGGFYIKLDPKSVSVVVNAYLYRDTAYLPVVCRVGDFGTGFTGEIVTCRVDAEQLAAALDDVAARAQRRLPAAAGDSWHAIEGAIGIRGPGRMVKAGVILYRVDVWYTGRWWWRKRHLTMRRTKTYALKVYDLEWRDWHNLPDNAPMQDAAALIVEDYRSRQKAPAPDAGSGRHPHGE